MSAALPGNPAGAGGKPAARQAPWWLRDARYWRMPALSLAGVMIVAAIAITASDTVRKDAQQQLLQAQRTRAAAQRQLRHVAVEKHDIATYQPVYATLLARGLVGPERRPDWIDSLRQVQQQYQLLTLSYDIGPRRQVAAPGMALGSFNLYASPMRLHLDLLHEGDLANLLLGLQAHSHVTVQECALRRTGSAQGGAAAGAAGGNLAGVAPTLTADCTLNWVTLVRGDGGAGAGAGAGAGGGAR